MQITITNQIGNVNENFNYAYPLLVSFAEVGT